MRMACTRWILKVWLAVRCFGNGSVSRSNSTRAPSGCLNEQAAFFPRLPGQGTKMSFSMSGLRISACSVQRGYEPLRKNVSRVPLSRENSMYLRMTSLLDPSSTVQANTGSVVGSPVMIPCGSGTFITAGAVGDATAVGDGVTGDGAGLGVDGGVVVGREPAGPRSGPAQAASPNPNPVAVSTLINARRSTVKPSPIAIVGNKKRITGNKPISSAGATTFVRGQ